MNDRSVIAPDTAEEDMAAALDDTVPTFGYQQLPMIGLGGSAGSIPALVKFFEAMPGDAGMAFVVVLHLAPDRESTLAQLLQRSTPMPVLQVQETAEVKADHIYVIPPGKALRSADGHLHLSTLDREQGRRTAVDLFFRTLADTHGPHAAAIVLSGVDGDGAIGIKRIKEHGGLTVAQDPDEAEHPSMPHSAISTGMVDWVLPVADMPQRLLAYIAQERQLRLPPEEGPQPAAPPPSDAGDDEAALREVLAFLHARTGHDFSYYKRGTILRRIGRRLLVTATSDLTGYVAHLRTHAGEAGALLQDLLISVTNFFRDSHAFAVLEQQITRLFEGKGPDDTVRVWVSACATGEEAYSVAMLLLEHAGRLDKPPRLQVFATDLDEESIQAARSGIYAQAITADVSQDRLRRFFVKEPRGWRVKADLRQIVLFAVHDLLKDPPFSRLDLVTCRNLLIYLNRDAQKRALAIFNFALRLDGLLFLGTSESIDDDAPNFQVIDKKYRLYSHRQAPRADAVLPIGAGTMARALAAKGRAGPTIPRALVAELGDEPSAADQAGPVLPAELHYQLLEKVAPPSVLIDAAHEVVHLSPGAGRFLQMTGGVPSHDLLQIVHPMLRIDLRAALFRATETRSEVQLYDLPMEENGSGVLVDIRVVPAIELHGGHMLIVFGQRSATNEADAAPGASRLPVDADPVTRHLERELVQMKSHLRDTVEQYETSVEELKASNEELQAMNEELRSATEELETGREESQSTAEELMTVNQELKSNVEQLGNANSDLHNLMGASAIATIFLDRELRIKRFTSPAVKLFNLLPSDLGRPFSDITHRLSYVDLPHDVARVLAELAPIEREVSSGDGRWYLARSLPYRTLDDHIAGVVLTLVDMTEQRRAHDAFQASQDALRLSNERLRLVVDNARDYAIISTDLERRLTTWNTGAEVLLGHPAAEVLGKMIDLIFTPEDRAANRPAVEVETALASGRALDNRAHLRKDGSRFWAHGALMPMRDAAGAALGFVKIMHDESESRAHQEALERSRNALAISLKDNEEARAQLVAASKAKDHFLAVLSHELRTPLTPVVTALHILDLQKDDLDPKVRSMHELIRRNVRIEAHLIDDLLDLTRVSRGTFDVLSEPMDVHEAIRGAIEISEPDIRSKNQTLSVALEAAEHRLKGDFNRLQQAVWNLLKNAAKFTPVRGEISLATRNERGRLLIIISDNGFGIDAAVLPVIFDAFRQGSEWMASKFGGLGLGLAIAKATVEKHGGVIRAESPGPDLGAVFTIDLPLTDDDGVTHTNRARR